MTMDPAIGDLPVGDVLIEDGVIVAVAHWQTQLRAICADWTLIDYVFGIRLAISPAYRADDVYLGNRLGAVEALNAGVTTILDFSHCNNTPQHADAAIAGLRDAGIRAVFGYGFFDSGVAAPGHATPDHFTEHRQRLADFGRVADGALDGSGGLLTLGAALTELTIVPFEAVRAEVEAARERSALVVAHTGCIWSQPSGVGELAAAGLLGPDQVHVHCNTLTDAGRARHGRPDRQSAPR
ncbi:MAG TPA: amidohydrolase family protein [Pseudonocardia sp.]|jgi:cytosine/adenosine deaminase-related metal-dependent hydrolase